MTPLPVQRSFCEIPCAESQIHRCNTTVSAKVFVVIGDDVSGLLLGFDHLREQRSSHVILPSTVSL